MQNEVKELKTKFKLKVEENNVIVQNYDKRFNMTVKEFVATKKEMAKNYENLKAIASMEVAVHEEIELKMQKVIDKYAEEMKEVK